MNDNNYENEDFIINKGFYNEIKDLVNCPICNKIINKPMQCSICENNFCEKCINEYIKKSNTCPFNCQNLKVLESSKVFKVLLSKIIYKNKENNIEEKLNFKCKECENEDCTETINEKNDFLDKEFENNRIELKQLYDEKRKILDELYKLKKLKIINEEGLIDKCIHFKANYKPIFKCCNQVYPCYICHDENELHPYIFSEKVLCLLCGNIYEGNECNKCLIKQLYIKK